MAKQGGQKIKLPDGASSLRHGQLQWLKITKTNGGVLSWLKKTFDFEESDLKDTLPPLQRPKIIDRGNYIFMILLFPLYDKKTSEVRPAEVDFFISKNYVITVNLDELLPLKKLFEECSTSQSQKLVCFNMHPATLLYEILNCLLIDASRMLVHVSNNVDDVEKKIFTEFEKGTIWTLLRTKTNIVNFRRSMQSHKLVINRLVELAPKFFPAQKLQSYFQNLMEMTEEIWDLLENYKDTVDALHETNVSLIDFRINEIMKTLTIFSVIVFPLTLFANLFSMNLQGMPLVDSPYGFWVASGIMIAAALSMLWLFEKKKWL